MRSVVNFKKPMWLAGLAASLVLAACAPMPVTLVATPANQIQTQSASAPTAPTAAFPVTIEHKYGSTTITQPPARIAVVGLTEQDALLALGVAPVGVTEWFGEYPGAIWPWAQDRLGDARPELIGDASTIKFETIAALKPDVILALYSGITQEHYDLLTKIAPTVAQPKEYVDYGIPWQELTHKVGQVVGKAEEADALVAEVEARIAQARADHPEFQGASAVVATPYEGVWVYGTDDVRGRLLTSLGFKLPEGINEITGKEFGGNLSMEHADMLDVDAIIWLDANETKGPLGGPLYANLDVAKEGREVFLSSYDDPLGGATSFVSVLSLPFLLDGLVPQLAAAVDGDLSTVVSSAQAKPTAEAGAAASGETREITDATGATVIVPANPQRVVVLSEVDLDSALALGLTPVGSVNGRGQPGLPQYLGDKASGIESVGTLVEPSLEKIVALKPDVILAGSMLDQIKTLLPELSKIAPVVATYKPSDDWKTAFKSIASMLNRQAVAEAFLGQYDERLSAIKKLLPEGQGAQANVARWMPQGPVVMMPATFSSLILADAGFARPEAVQALAGSHGAHTDPLSLEKLDVMDSNWLFLGTLNAEGATALDAALKNPLFQKLDVVQRGHVVPVDGAVWTSVGGPLAALVVLDDIEKALTAK